MEIASSNQRFLASQLDNVEKQYGELTPYTTVEYARPDDSPLHRYFEWDDAVAAEKHRLQQARTLIKRVYLAIPDRDDEENVLQVRYYQSLEQEPENDDNPNRRYVNIYMAMSDDQLRLQTLRNAKRELEAFSRKYKDLKELASIMAVITDTVEKIA